MRNKYRHEHLVGSLLYKDKIQQTSLQETKSAVKDAFLKKLIACKNKSLSKNSSLKLSVSKSRQSKLNKKLLSSSTICSSQCNISALHCSVNSSDPNLNKQLSCNNIVKPKHRIRNRQQELDLIHMNNNNENSFIIINNNNSMYEKENLSNNQLPQINMKQLIGQDINGNKQYDHYFKFNETQKKCKIKTQLQFQEQIFNKLRKEYCFYQSNKRKNQSNDRESIMQKIAKMFDMFKRNEKKVDYFHSGKSKEHIFKYRFKKCDIDNCI